MSKLIPFLAKATGLRSSDVMAIIARAPVSYKYYMIAKRNGGQRLISQPAREVKTLQRILALRLSALPVHEAATAYVPGLSIRDNAQRHAKNGPIIKFDFENFFPSIKARDWEAYCLRNTIFSEKSDVALSSRLFFSRRPESSVLRLAIGAPSSPWLSNVLMFEFDRRITESVMADKVTYTRYADDLTFSAPRTGFLNKVQDTLRLVLAELDHPRLKLNEDKTVLATKKYRREVTGLILANDGRVTIGREKKREIRAALHHAVHQRLDGEQMARLAGLLAYVKSVEPDYFALLVGTYGSALLLSLNMPFNDTK